MFVKEYLYVDKDESYILDMLKWSYLWDVWKKMSSGELKYRLLLWKKKYGLQK